jgi:hypothetical protein
MAGFDPGSVNLGAGGINFFGLVDIVDDAGQVKTIPNITIAFSARWDITRGLVVQSDASIKKRETINVNQSTLKSEKMLDWGDALAACVSHTDWLFQPYKSLLADDDDEEEELPLILVENQCDHKKTEYVKTQMLQISNMISSSVQAIDCEKRKTTLAYPAKRRVHCHGMTKYGQRSDGSRIRTERKEKAVDDLMELLAQLAATDLPTAASAKLWLAHFKYLESVKEQIHDRCDAILSVVHKGNMLYKNHLKGNIKRQRVALKALPVPEKVVTKGRRKKAEDSPEKKARQEDIKNQRALLKKIPMAPIQKRKRSDDSEPKTKKKRAKVEKFPLLLSDKIIEL